ncbi:anaerobic ribonucleoside-triphosphate reductase [Clostridium sp.]|uniref:anaerobic ribonucleoside-triphosphate reductase n=1 Tax=Clostridium sp. TaxID=1506 RepID=UPI003F3DE0FF
MTKTLNIIKRDGNSVKFDKNKIENAILKAMKYGSGIYEEEIAKTIANEIEESQLNKNTSPTVYQIEEMVYAKLINYNQQLTAKAYEGYRAVQSFKREINTTDESILGILNRSNEEVINENSNKDGILAATQRDLIAGEVSKDIARRKLIPAHIAQAHDEGVLHYHK